MVKKINYVKRKTSKTQTIWNYIRRNPNFRVSEVMIVCDVSIEYLRRFLNALEQAGYLKFSGKTKLYSSKEYRLLRNTGVIAPKIIKNKEIYDENIKESFVLNYDDLKNVPQIMTILKFLQDNNYATQSELSLFCRISKEEFDFIILKFKKYALYIDSFIEENERNYVFDSCIATKILKKLR